MHPTLINLTEENKNMMSELVDSGLYATSSEVIRDALRQIYAKYLRMRVASKISKIKLTKKERITAADQLLKEHGFDPAEFIENKSAES